MEIKMPIGDIVDKLSILLIKEKRLSCKISIRNVKKELEYIHKKWQTEINIRYTTLPEWEELCKVNNKLWSLEERIRLKNKTDNEIIEDAHLIHFLNDRRAHLKRSINISLNSEFIEEKSY